MLFQRGQFQLHPTTVLIAWLSVVVVVQFVGYPLIFVVMLLIILFATKTLPHWWRYVHRSRWLLLGVWLVLAYGLPGDALFDLVWMPTWQGVDAGNLQAVRLVIILGCLGWLFSHLGRDGLVVALWGLLQPLARLGLDRERLVVRLSLVLDQLNTPQEKGAWRKMLGDVAPHPAPLLGQEMLEIRVPKWRPFDTLTVILLCFALLAAGSMR